MLRKIIKVDALQVFYPIKNVNSSNFLQTNCRSSIESLKISSVFSCILNEFKKILRMIICLFCFSSKKIKKSTVLNVAFNPEIDPSVLSIRDGFYKAVFGSNNRLKNEGALRFFFELFKILGEGNQLQWGICYNRIRYLQKEIEKYDFHPLERLYLIFHNKEVTKRVCHFFEKAPTSAREHFFEEFTERFKAYQFSIKNEVPGYCKIMFLDEFVVAGLVQKSNWLELIRYSFESRKKHFNL